MLQMKEVTVGAIGTCCYILWDDARTDCVVIDPGDEPSASAKRRTGARLPRFCSRTGILTISARFGH